MARRKHAQPCKWCGREVDDAELGRRRQYCRQSCRQRAYEQRAAVKGTSVPADAVVLTADEAADLADRVYQARCAAEDVATAVEEGATQDELRQLCEELLRSPRLPTAGVSSLRLLAHNSSRDLNALIGCQKLPIPPPTRKDSRAFHDHP